MDNSLIMIIIDEATKTIISLHKFQQFTYLKIVGDLIIATNFSDSFIIFEWREDITLKVDLNLMSVAKTVTPKVVADKSIKKVLTATT